MNSIHLLLTICLLVATACFGKVKSLMGPQIAGNNDGNVVVVWSEIGARYYQVNQAFLPSGGSWSSPAAVSSATGDAFYPAVAMNNSGNILYAWQQHGSSSSYETAIAYASFNGSASAPEFLQHQTGMYPKVAICASGNAIVVWRRSATAAEGLGIANCPPLSTTCTVATEAPSGTSPIFPDAAICTASGDAMVVWQEYTNNNQNAVIRAVPIPSGDTWGTPVTVSSTDTFASNPSVVYVATGEALVIWQEPVGDYVAVRVASYSGGVWGATTTFSLSDAHVVNPNLAADASGNLVLVAESMANSAYSVILAQRTSGGVWSSLSTLAANGQRPRIAMSQTGASGVAVVVWEGVATSPTTVQASVLLPSSSWSAATTLSSAGVASGWPKVWMSRTGDKAVAVWRESPTTAVDIFSSTFSSGSSTWSAASSVN